MTERTYKKDLEILNLVSGFSRSVPSFLPQTFYILQPSRYVQTAIVQWRRPFGLLLLLVNFLQQLFINKLEILNQLTIPCRGSLNNSSNLEKRDKITCFQTKLEKHYKKKLWYSDTVFENYIKNLILVQCEQSELRFLSLNFRAKSQYWNL